jgi:hypothetical protein
MALDNLHKGIFELVLSDTTIESFENEIMINGDDLNDLYSLSTYYKPLDEVLYIDHIGDIDRIKVSKMTPPMITDLGDI